MSTRPTCALCGGRDATGVTDYEHRTIPACAECLTPPDDPGDYEPTDLIERAEPPSEVTRNTFATRNAIVEAIRRMSEPATTRDVCEALGIKPGTLSANAISNCLGRLVRRGELHREWIRPGDKRGGGLYTIAPKVVRVREVTSDKIRQRVLDDLEERGEVIVPEVAKRTGAHPDTVSRVLGALGIPLRRVRRGMTSLWVREVVPA
jgi:hypothetical protein